MESPTADKIGGTCKRQLLCVDKWLFSGREGSAALARHLACMEYNVDIQYVFLSALCCIRAGQSLLACSLRQCHTTVAQHLLVRYLLSGVDTHVTTALLRQLPS